MSEQEVSEYEYYTEGATESRNKLSTDGKLSAKAKTPVPLSSKRK